jgi:hypothetical protein
VLLPKSTFINVFNTDSDGSLESRIVEEQFKVKAPMKQWEQRLPIYIDPENKHRGWRSIATHKYIIPPNDEIRKEIATN